MNDDLISRQAAIELIKNNSYTIRHGLNDVEKGMTLYGIIQALEHLPSVQPKTGRWKHVEIESNKSDTGYFMLPICECSVCDLYVERKSNYCPHCGARMEGKNERDFIQR